MAGQTKWRSNEGDWKGTSARGSSTALLACLGRDLPQAADLPDEDLAARTRERSTTLKVRRPAANVRPAALFP